MVKMVGLKSFATSAVQLRPALQGNQCKELLDSFVLLLGGACK